MSQEPTTIHIYGEYKFKLIILDSRSIVVPRTQALEDILKSTSYPYLVDEKRRLFIVGRGAIRYFIEQLERKKIIHRLTKQHIFSLLDMPMEKQREIPSAWVDVDMAKKTLTSTAHLAIKLGSRDMRTTQYLGQTFLLHACKEDRASADYEAFFMALLQLMNHYSPEPIIFHQKGKRVYIGSEYISSAKPLLKVLFEFKNLKEREEFVYKIAPQLGMILTLAKLFKEVDLNSGNILVTFINGEPILIWIDHDYTFFPVQCKYKQLFDFVHDTQYPTSPKEAYPEATKVVSATSALTTSHDNPFNWIVRWDAGADGHYKADGRTNLGELFLLLPGIDSPRVQARLKEGNAKALYSLAVMPLKQIEAIADAYMRSPKAKQVTIDYFDGLSKDLWPVFFADPRLSSYFLTNREKIAESVKTQFEAYNEGLRPNQKHLAIDLDTVIDRLPTDEKVPSLIRQGIARFFSELDERLSHLEKQIEAINKIMHQDYDVYITNVVKLMRLLSDEDKMLVLIAQQYAGETAKNHPCLGKIGNIETLIALYERKIRKFEETIDEFMPEEFFTRAENLSEFLEVQTQCWQQVLLKGKKDKPACQQLRELFATLGYLMRLTIEYYQFLEKFSYLEVEAIEYCQPLLSVIRMRFVCGITDDMAQLQEDITIQYQKLGELSNISAREDRSYLDRQELLSDLDYILIELEKLEQRSENSTMKMSEFKKSMSFLCALFNELKAQLQSVRVLMASSVSHTTSQFYQPKKNKPVRSAGQRIEPVASTLCVSKVSGS